MARAAKSLNSPTFVNKLFIVVICHFSPMSITTLCANLGSLLTIGFIVDGTTSSA
jgi:hypothetical protein